MSYKKKIVQKPWGYEYLVFENDKVALWFLHIAYNQKTSMHCHPNKTTGLILLDGEAQISFLGDKFDLKPVSKTMIRKGLFHSTKATSENGACVFEIETPVDKHDLVRLEDKYGREGNPYEDETHEAPKQDDCLWIEDEDKEYSLHKVTASAYEAQDYSDSGEYLVEPVAMPPTLQALVEKFSDVLFIIPISNAEMQSNRRIVINVKMHLSTLRFRRLQNLPLQPVGGVDSSCEHAISDSINGQLYGNVTATQTEC